MYDRVIAYLLVVCFVLIEYSYYCASVIIVDDENKQVNSSLYRTANKYICKYDEIANPDMIIYGSKAWRFPKQGVNLTLSYPSKHESNAYLVTEPYVITGFIVILFVDTTDTRAFITSGGIMQESISLTFECSDLTALFYEFWLYGVTKSSLEDVQLHTTYKNHVCTGSNSDSDFIQAFPIYPINKNDSYPPIPTRMDLELDVDAR